MTERFEGQDREPSACPPQIKGIIAAMEQVMDHDPSLDHAGTILDTVTDLIENGQAQSFAEIENWLRECGSRAYLIALPLDYFADGFFGADGFELFCPGDRIKKPEYIASAEVGGREAMKKKLVEINITPEENAERLSTAGRIRML